MKRIRSLLALLLCTITILTCIPVESQAGLISAGSQVTGGSGGGSGTWGNDQQGWRIYIVDNAGYVVSNTVDILFSANYPTSGIIGLNRKVDMDAMYGWGLGDGYGAFQYVNSRADGEAKKFNNQVMTWSDPYITLLLGNCTGTYRSVFDRAGTRDPQGKHFISWLGGNLATGVGGSRPTYTYTPTNPNTTGSNGAGNSSSGSNQGNTGNSSSSGSSASAAGLAQEFNRLMWQQFNLGKASRKTKSVAISMAVSAATRAYRTMTFDDNTARVIRAMISSTESDMRAVPDWEVSTGKDNESLHDKLQGIRSTSSKNIYKEESSLIDSFLDIAYADNSQQEVQADAPILRLLEGTAGAQGLFYLTTDKIKMSQKLITGSDGVPTKKVDWTQTLIDNDLRIMIEPVFWFIPETHDRGSSYGAMFYGTPTEYAAWQMQWRNAGGWSDNSGSAAYDGGRMMVVLNNYAKGSPYIDSSNELSFPSGFGLLQSITPGMESGSKHIEHDLLYRRRVGYAVGYIRPTADPGLPEINTYDPNEIDPNPTPHPAEDPDPTHPTPEDPYIPLKPAEPPEEEKYRETTRRHHIVKVYDIEHLDGTLEHVTTKNRDYTPGTIHIESEVDYKVVGWFTSPQWIGEGLWEEAPELIEPTDWETCHDNPTIEHTFEKEYEWDSVKDAKIGEEVFKVVQLGTW